jgi:hypothetical protein
MRNYLKFGILGMLVSLTAAGCSAENSNVNLFSPGTAQMTPTASAPTPTSVPAPSALPFSSDPDLPIGAALVAHTYGAGLNDMGYDLLLLEDGGTLIVGKANNTAPSHRITPGDGRAMRTDAEGRIIWQQDYGEPKDSLLYSPIQVGEDEFVILGEIAADYTRDEEDLYLIKIDGEGNLIWSHMYGGRGNDAARMVRQTADGGFILVGDLADETPTRGLYESNILLIKTDAEGDEEWRRTYGEEELYVGWAVEQTRDGGYVVTGWEAKTYDDRDVFIFKTDAEGEVEWYRTWDLTPGDWDGGYDMILTSDGYIVVSCIKAMLSERRAVLIKLDLEGNEVWVKAYADGASGSTFWDIMEDSDGGYVMAGYLVESLDMMTGKGVLDGLILKTDQDGELVWQYTITGSEFDQIVLSSAVLLPEGGYIFIGSATKEGEEYSDMLQLRFIENSGAIAFASERDGNSEIYLSDVNGGNVRRLTDDPAYDAWPSWSPDGSQLAFMSDRSGNPDIFVMNADGSGVRQLTFDEANDIWPEWSPDGSRIAFPSRRDGNFELYTINPDGTNLQRLTDTPGHEDFPAWSPDGSQIAFSRIEIDEGFFVMDADGGNERKLLDFPALEPAWSPDGTSILFGSDHEGFRGIYSINADGSDLQRISTSRAGENCPAWSPDGSRIVFASWRDGDGEIYVMNLDGGNLIKVTDNRMVDEFPAWRPVP